MPTPWFTLRKSDAPPRPPWRQIAAVTVMSIMTLIVLAFIGEITGFALLTPPLAASMALIAGCPNLPLSQPRNVIGGQLLSAIVGCAVGVVSHSVWALAIAGGLALGVMLAARRAGAPESPEPGVVTAVSRPSRPRPPEAWAWPRASAPDWSCCRNTCRCEPRSRRRISSCSPPAPHGWWRRASPRCRDRP